MTVVALLLIVVATAAMVAFVRKEVRAAVAGLEQAHSEALDRDAALYKQAKALTTRQARVTAAAAKAVDETRKLRDDSRSLHLSVQEVLLAPKVQAVLNQHREEVG